ncbi:MAG: helix-turn-helix domain-containing protein [Acidobacteriota bacterium]
MRTNGSTLSAQKELDLPAIRQHKGVSLRQIADTTKISMRFLLAIEKGDWKQLPGGIYNTSYIRQYARQIGYEETKLLAYYRSLAETA